MNEIARHQRGPQPRGEGSTPAGKSKKKKKNKKEKPATIEQIAPPPTEDGFTLVTRKKRNRGPTGEDRGPARSKRTLLEGIQTGGKASGRKGSNALIIQPADGTQATYSQALQALERMVDPETLGSTIRGVRTTKKGHIVIRTGSKEDAEKLDQELQKGEHRGITWRTSTPRHPRVVLTGVPRTWSEEELKAKVLAKTGPGTSSFSPTFRPLFKRGPKESWVTQWVVEVDPTTRRTLQEAPINIGWLRVAVHDYIEQPRCFKCQAFGHISTKCPSTQDTCSWCAGNGHSQGNCKKKELPPKCINCHAAGIRRCCDHPASSKKCPAYLRFLDRKLKATQYV